MDTDIKRPGQEEVTNLVDVFHGLSKHTLRRNELLDYLRTNNAFGKIKFINYNFDDSTLLPRLSTIQQDVSDYLNEFIALQSVRDEYYKELTKPILLP